MYFPENSIINPIISSVNPNTQKGKHVAQGHFQTLTTTQLQNINHLSVFKITTQFEPQNVIEHCLKIPRSLPPISI